MVCGAALAGLVAVKTPATGPTVPAAEVVNELGPVIAKIVVPAGKPPPVMVAPASKPAVLGPVTVVPPAATVAPTREMGAGTGLNVADATGSVGEVSTPLELKVNAESG